MNALFRLLRALLCLLIPFAGVVHAGCIDQKRLLGVNLSGAEFGEKRLPGVLNKDYVYPSRNDLTYFRGQGMNLIRLPFRWERVQHQVNTPLDQNELAELRRVVTWAKEMDLCILLDLHNFGTYQGRVLGSPELPTSAFIDVWLRLHQAFPDSTTTAFGLMNEPAALTPSQWMKVAQETVLALRKNGVENLLLVGSGRWSGAHEWDRPFDAVSAATAFRAFRDPLNNFAIEVHQYADPHYSGTEKSCIDASRLRDIMGRLTAWALQEKKKFLLGEFGVANSSECLDALNSMLGAMQNSDAWLGWSYWSAGAWWGPYPFSIQPANGQEAAQMGTLRSYLPPTIQKR